MPGRPEASELYLRVSLAPDHEDVMPAEGELLTQAEQELIRRWIEEGARTEARAPALADS